MKKSMFHEIKEDEDVTDIIAKFIAFMTIPAAVFVMGFTLWTIL